MLVINKSSSLPIPTHCKITCQPFRLDSKNLHTSAPQPYPTLGAHSRAVPAARNVNKTHAHRRNPKLYPLPCAQPPSSLEAAPAHNGRPHLPTLTFPVTLTIPLPLSLIPPLIPQLALPWPKLPLPPTRATQIHASHKQHLHSRRTNTIHGATRASPGPKRANNPIRCSGGANPDTTSQQQHHRTYPQPARALPELHPFPLPPHDHGRPHDACQRARRRRRVGAA